jgi:hypothetical protein
MTVSVDLPQELEARLEAQARTQGKTAAEYLAALVETLFLPASETGESRSGTTQPNKVFLIYKRQISRQDNSPDKHVVDLLRAQLLAHGYHVFSELSTMIGAVWAKELQRQLAEADIVIALLSSASMQSEMVECEIQTALEAAQNQRGSPHLLPVLINYRSALPETYARLLGATVFGQWNHPCDDTRLVEEILHRLESLSPHN